MELRHGVPVRPRTGTDAGAACPPDLKGSGRLDSERRAFAADPERAPSRVASAPAAAHRWGRSMNQPAILGRARSVLHLGSPRYWRWRRFLSRLTLDPDRLPQPVDGP